MILEAPVPPSATAKSVMPVIVPPEIVTEPVKVGLVNIVALVSFKTLPRPTMVLVMPDTVPVNVGLSSGALSPRAVVTVVAKLASSFRAAASSSNVSRAPGAELIKLATSVLTYCVVAICVVLVPATAVGAVGVPVSAALVNMVALDSLVTLPKPTIAAETPDTVPVNVGLENMVALDSLVTLPSPKAVALGNTRLRLVSSPDPVMVAPTTEPCVIVPMFKLRFTEPALISVPLSNTVIKSPSVFTAMSAITAALTPDVPCGPIGP